MPPDILRVPISSVDLMGCRMEIPRSMLKFLQDVLSFGVNHVESSFQVRGQTLCRVRPFHLYSVGDPKFTSGSRYFVSIVGQSNAEPSHSFIKCIPPGDIKGVPSSRHKHV